MNQDDADTIAWCLSCAYSEGCIKDEAELDRLTDVVSASVDEEDDYYD